MTIEFTLYDTFVSDDEITLTEKRVENINVIIEKMSREQKTVLTRLILEHRKRNKENMNVQKIPYKGKQKNNKLVFDTEHLPSKLQTIIYKYCKVCKKTFKKDG